MFRYQNQILVGILLIADLALAFATWEMAYFMRFFWLDWPHSDFLPPHSAYFKAAPIVVLMGAIVFIANGAYRTQRIHTLGSEVWVVLKSSFWLFGVILAIAFFYRKFSYSRIHMVYFLLLYSSSLMLFRAILHQTIAYFHRRGTHVENVLVIGTSKMAEKFVEALQRYPQTGIKIKGIVQLPNAPVAESLRFMALHEGLENLNQIIRDQEVDQVFVALSALEQVYLPRIQSALATEMVDIRVIPDLGTFHTLRTDVENFEGIPIVTVVQSPLTGWNQVIKRLFDFWGALVCLLVFAPVMLLVATAVKLTSRGPIIYRQERMGLDGQTFETLKFRSMKIDAESKSGAVWASKGDDRTTSIGSFLRKTSLDELPQLFNVLKGEMSLVGPRPERPIFIEQFKTKIPNYMLRHKIKAGITGWAQVNGWRGNTSLEKRIEYDLHYIEHWSLWFDIKILFLTLFKGFVNPNAY